MNIRNIVWFSLHLTESTFYNTAFPIYYFCKAVYTINNKHVFYSFSLTKKEIYNLIYLPLIQQTSIVTMKYIIDTDKHITKSIDFKNSYPTKQVRTSRIDLLMFKNEEIIQKFESFFIKNSTLSFTIKQENNTNNFYVYNKR